MSEVLQTVPGFVSKQFRRHELSKSSPEFQRALGSFYDSTEYKNCVTRLHDAALDEFINFLDDVRSQMFVACVIRSRILTNVQVLNTQGLPQELFERTLNKLREACSYRSIFPGSLVVSSEISGLTTNPHATGEDVTTWKGKLNLRGDSNVRIDVCVKTIGKVYKVSIVLSPVEASF